MKLFTVILILLAAGSVDAYQGWTGRIDTVMNYWPNGQLQERFVQKVDTVSDRKSMYAGPYESWYENGAPDSNGTFWDDRKNGHWRWRYPDGTPKESGEFVEDRKTGVWIGYHANGVLAQVTRYTYGKKLGLSETWDEAGLPTSVLRFADDHLHGPCIWFGSGQTKTRHELYFFDTLLVAFSAEINCSRSGRFYNEEYDLQVDWDDNCQNFRVGRIIDGYKQGTWTFFHSPLEQALGSREVIYEKGTIVRR